MKDDQLQLYINFQPHIFYGMIIFREVYAAADQNKDLTEQLRKCQLDFSETNSEKEKLKEELEHKSQLIKELKEKLKNMEHDKKNPQEKVCNLEFSCMWRCEITFFKYYSNVFDCMLVIIRMEKYTTAGLCNS